MSPINIKTRSGCNHFIECDVLHTTGLTVKTIMHHRHGFRVADHLLIYAGKVVRDNDLLVDYGVTKGSVIHMVPRNHPNNTSPNAGAAALPKRTDEVVNMLLSEQVAADLNQSFEQREKPSLHFAPQQVPPSGKEEAATIYSAPAPAPAPAPVPAARNSPDNTSSSLTIHSAPPSAHAPVPVPAPFSAPAPQPAPAPLPVPALLPANTVIDLTGPLQFPCYVCAYRESDVILHPCRHLCICTCCAMHLGPQPKCPRCRVAVTTFTTVTLPQ